MLTRADCDWIEARAKASGFDLAGLAAVPDPADAQAIESDQRFTDWIAAGHAGEMDYLKRVDEAGNFLRGKLQRAMPWARSVLVCALNYNAAAPRSIDPAPATAGWIARYAWNGKTETSSGEGNRGSDYHDVLLPKLRDIEANIKQRFGDTTATRCYVDTGPILERGFASLAGVGWIGKNTCVLNQQQGSWLLLGVIVTSLDLAPEALAIPAADRCGSCTRCIDACPTGALLGSGDRNAPREMDASRCIAYLTIEKKGSIAEELRGKMGRQVFGCDICQDVCPWNTRAPVAPSAALSARPELINPALAWLASMDGPTFNRWFRGSPLERTRRKRLRRNVAIAMGNSGERGFLPELETMAKDEDPHITEAAQWSIKRLSAPS